MHIMFACFCLVRYGLHVTPGAVETGVEKVCLSGRAERVRTREVLDMCIVFLNSKDVMAA